MADTLPQAAGQTALLLIDMINDMDFGHGGDLLAEMEAVADVVAALRDAAEAAGVPVIFVNDNFGRWHSDRARIIEHVEQSRGRDTVAKLRPKPDDYFVIKPQVSGFYATNLPVLLPRLGVSRLVLTGGIGPDACIDSVGLEAHGFFVDNVVDQIKASTFLGTDRAHANRQAVLACRKGGRVSMPAVYGGFVDKWPLGAFMEKGLTLKTGQTHVQHYLPGLLDEIMEGKIDTTFLISHRMPLEQAPQGYKMFHDQQNEVTKIVLKPGMVPETAIAAE